jgi:hypothetical protein
MIVFIYAHCVYDAFMLHVLDEMMIDMFLRPLLLLLLVFPIFCCFLGPVVPLGFLRSSRESKAHFLASIRTKHKISRTTYSVTQCPEHEPTYEEELEDHLTQQQFDDELQVTKGYRSDAYSGGV